MFSSSSNFVTGSSKDGLPLPLPTRRDAQRTDNDEIRARQARRSGQGGHVEFEKPQPNSLKLPARLAVSSELATIFLIDKATGRLELHLRASCSTARRGERGAGPRR